MPDKRLDEMHELRGFATRPRGSDGSYIPYTENGKLMIYSTGGGLTADFLVFDSGVRRSGAPHQEMVTVDFTDLIRKGIIPKENVKVE